MPRRSSSTSSRSRPTPQARPTAPVPQQTPAAPVPAQPQQPGLFAQMASTAAGVAVGSTVGHVIGGGISSLFGGSSSSQPVQQQQQPQQMEQAPMCEPDQKAFMKCLDQNQNNISACQFYLDMLKQCQADAKYQ